MSQLQGLAPRTVSKLDHGKVTTCISHFTSVHPRRLELDLPVQGLHQQMVHMQLHANLHRKSDCAVRGERERWRQATSYEES